MTYRLVALLLSFALAAPVSAQRRTADDMVTVQVATVGIGIVTRAPVVVLHDPVTDKTMPVWIGTAEAQAIARSLAGFEPPRPMTHDLFADVLRALGARVEAVLVHDSKDGIYYGRLHVRDRDGRLSDVDTRPSDALALALRTGAPIRVKRQILDEAPEIKVVPEDGVPDFARALGLTVMSPDDDIRKLFSLPRRPGVVVVEARGEASAAGLERGDLIVEVNGRVPKDGQAFWDAVRAGGAGKPVKIRFWRSGKETEVLVTPPRPEGVPGAVPA